MLALTFCQRHKNAGAHTLLLSSTHDMFIIIKDTAPIGQGYYDPKLYRTIVCATAMLSSAIFLLLWERKRRSPAAINRSRKLKSNRGQVFLLSVPGLYNIGNSCYLNSTIQASHIATCTMPHGHMGND